MDALIRRAGMLSFQPGPFDVSRTRGGTFSSQVSSITVCILACIVDRCAHAEICVTQREGQTESHWTPTLRYQASCRSAPHMFISATPSAFFSERH